MQGVNGKGTPHIVKKLEQIKKPSIRKGSDIVDSSFDDDFSFDRSHRSLERVSGGRSDLRITSGNVMRLSTDGRNPSSKTLEAAAQQIADRSTSSTCEIAWPRLKERITIWILPVKKCATDIEFSCI
jgi:hypothetical protein